MEESRQHMAKLGRSPHGGRGLKHKGRRGKGEARESLPTRGAWIETSSSSCPCISSRSLPTRGAWIETQLQSFAAKTPLCRSPHGGRGLKRPFDVSIVPLGSRSPHGGRGLKQSVESAARTLSGSLPTRGAWIETLQAAMCGISYLVAPHTGGVD